MNKHCLLSIFVATALFSGQPQVVEGSARFSQNKQLLEITTGTKHTHLRWEKFSISKGETVKFTQPSKNSAVLNRVLHDPTHILGNLESNGHIFLLNPNGIVIGKEGRVKAHSCILSTHDTDSIKGYFDESGIVFSGTGGEITNLGTIEGVGGNVYLIANRVENSGSLIANSGNVAIGAAEKILITTDKTEKLAILTDRESAGIIENSGTITGKSITLKARNNPYTLAIRHTGIIDATEIDMGKNAICLVAENSRLLIEENAQIKGANAHVELIGHEVYLKNETMVDVSSIDGGGDVYVGGGFQGKTPELSNSQITYMGEEAKILADGLGESSGGTIVLWSDGVTGFFGSLSAEGGSQGGDGGFIEVSGIEKLVPNGTVSTRAPLGKLGTTLFDPTDITISAAATSGGSFVGGVFVPTAGTSNILNSDLYTNLNASNVTVSTTSAFAGTGDISITAAFDYNATAGGGGLTLFADQDINIDADTDFTYVLADNNSMTFTATRDINLNDNLLVENLAAFTMTTTNGDVNVSTASNLDCNNITQITINAGNDFFIDNTGATSGQINTATSSAINVTAGNDAIILGRIENNINGDISVTATRDIKVGPSTGTIGQARSRIGTLFGDVRIDAGRDLLLEAGFNDDDAYAQIGYNAASINSDIYLTVGRNLTLLSTDSNDDGFTLIGHGGSAGNFAGLKQGNIIINSVGGDLTLEARGGPGNTECFSQIGHAHVDDSDIVTLKGDIRGPTAGSYAQITGDVKIEGGVATQAYALIGHGGSNVTGNLFLEGNILIEAKNFEIEAGSAQDTAAGIGFRTRFSGGAPRTCTISNASVKVKADELITLVAGGAAGDSGAVFIGGYVNTTSNSRFGDIDIAEIDIEAGTNITILGGISSANENLSLFGAKVINTEVTPQTTPGTSRSSLTITTGGDMSVITRNGEATFIQNGDTTTAGRTFNMNIGHDLFLMGEAEGITVDAIDTGNITVGRNLSLYSDNEAAVINAESTLNVTVGQDILLLGHCRSSGSPTFTEALIHNQSGDLTVIAGRDINLQPFGRIRTEGTGNTVIVVDNDFPTAPGIGPGQLNMNVHSRIGTTGGPSVQIFTAKRSQNSILNNYGSTFVDAAINGTEFTPGTLFVDSATEIWQTYFPSSSGGTPYTIFYKDGPTTPSSLPTLITILNEDPRFFFANYELFWKPFYRYNLLGDLPESPWPNLNCEVQCELNEKGSCNCPSSMQPFRE